MRRIVIFVCAVTVVIVVAFLVILILALTGMEDLTVLDSSLNLEGDLPRVFGTARNDTDHVMNEPIAQVRWYDGNGTLVYTSNAYNPGDLGPWEEWDFVVTGFRVDVNVVVDYELKVYD